ncbi:hypothetical protein RRG08_057749 [Elysia crispata]|uniref:Uncharacterized protein n=1 Tax=Elysia crispata TaxID=231223 RepID=A0AAE1CYR2_9GAST|nr:hypothetical protein RRG08_057749 [Elysia crispata]
MACFPTSRLRRSRADEKINLSPLNIASFPSGRVLIRPHHLRRSWLASYRHVVLRHKKSEKALVDLGLRTSCSLCKPKIGSKVANKEDTNRIYVNVSTASEDKARCSLIIGEMSRRCFTIKLCRLEIPEYQSNVVKIS